jgi:hypothetical protein
MNQTLLKQILNWVVARLEERSTWTGIGALIATMAFLPNATANGQMVATVGTALAGFLAVVIPGGK